MQKTLKPLLILLLTASVMACASAQRKDLLRETLDGYGSAVRWGNVETALVFIDPELLAQRPVSALDLERYRQIQITSYRDGDAVTGSDGLARQTVGISFINRHTMVERALVDQQVWRYDSEAKRWWLTTGLFDITGGR